MSRLIGILSSFALAFSGGALAQIHVVSPPKSGYEARIRSAISEIRIVDTHDHLRGVSTLIRERPLDFSLLINNYSRMDLSSAGMPPEFFNKLWSTSGVTAPEKWQALQPYWDRAFNTAFNRVVVLTADRLFGIGSFDFSTVEALSKRVAEAYDEDPHGWFYHVLKEKCRIDYVIQDSLSPSEDGDLRPEIFKFVQRFDHFVLLQSRKDIENRARRVGLQGIATLDDLVSALDADFSRGVERDMVGVKSGLAYVRTLDYEKVSKEAAEAAFAKIRSSPESVVFADAKPVQDYVMHRLLGLIDRHRLPIQFHTGLQWGYGNRIENSKPTHLTNLLFDYPNVKFIFFHGSYPYGGELATIVKAFQNAYIDANWTYIISPSYAKRYLHEWLETVPASKLMAFGGDDGSVEAVFGNVSFAREIISDVLIEKVATGYFTETEALKVARMILRENGLRVFNLEG